MHSPPPRHSSGQLLLLACITMIFTLVLLISFSVATVNIGKSGGRDDSHLQEEYLMVVREFEAHLNDAADVPYDPAAASAQDETVRVVQLVWHDVEGRISDLEAASGYSLSVPMPDAANISGAANPRIISVTFHLAGPAGDQIVSPEQLALQLG